MFAFLHHPNIDPVILNIWGPLAIRWYSLMYIIGFLAVYFITYYMIKSNKIRLTEQKLSDVVFVGMLGVLIGARLGYVLFYDLWAYIQNPLKIFAVWEGGMSFHGALIFTILFVFIFLRIKKENFFDYADVIIISVPLGLGFGRWGNFVNGELWGKPTDVPWGMIFPAKQYVSKAGEIAFIPPHFSIDLPWVQNIISNTGLVVPANQAMVNLPRHPSQLYEMILEGIVLFLVLFFLARMKNKPPRGMLISIFLAGYGIIRFLIEFLREPDAHIGYLIGTDWLTMGMVLSTPLIIVGVAGMILSAKLNQTNALWITETVAVTKSKKKKA